ncbi:MAG: hypothetical protein AB2L20_11790 [Mangrovibacterium sp.]
MNKVLPTPLELLIEKLDLLNAASDYLQTNWISIVHESKLTEDDLKSNYKNLNICIREYKYAIKVLEELRVSILN